MWHSSRTILLLLRQDPEVAEYASLYLRWLSIGLPAFVCHIVFRRFYQSIGDFQTCLYFCSQFLTIYSGLVHVPSLIIVIIAPINALLNYILGTIIFHLGLCLDNRKPSLGTGALPSYQTKLYWSANCDCSVFQPYGLVLRSSLHQVFSPSRLVPYKRPKRTAPGVFRRGHRVTSPHGACRSRANSQ